jgi:hypothetical protein
LFVAPPARLFEALVTPALLALALGSLSCRSLDRFDTTGNPAFCGELVSGPSFHDGFIADEQPQRLGLKLELDTGQLAGFADNKAALPGRLTSDDAALGLCTDRPLFEDAQMRTIPQVYHDSLSTLSFGEGHDEDFFAWVDSSCQGTMLSLVSLLRNGNVEVRLFKPAAFADGDVGSDKRPGYALFYLTRSEKGCDF